MRLIQLMRDSRPIDGDPYIYRHGNKWIGDFRKSTFGSRKNNAVTYWLDASGRRSTSWNSRQTRRHEYVRHIGLDLHDFTGAPRYQRRGARILQCQYEFKEISDDCVLVKRTNTIWTMASAEGRYTQVNDSMVTAALSGTPSVVEAQYFAILTTPRMRPAQYTADDTGQKNRLYLGLETELQENKLNVITASKTTPSEYVVSLKSAGSSAEELMIIKELRGMSAKLWNQEDVTHDAVVRILNPSASASYSLPSSIKRKKIQWHLSQETFNAGNLTFSKMDMVPPLVSGENLRDIHRNEGINIVVSIPEKCLITFPREGQMVSQEVEGGVYAIQHTNIIDVGGIFDRRLLVIQALAQYRIEFDLNRYDFLTVLDIDTDILTTTDGSLGRIGSIEEIDGQTNSENESLLDRIR